MAYKFKHIAVGGTFDLLHMGHEAFILKAFSNASFVTIGITSDELAESLTKNNIDDFKRRKNAVLVFLMRKNLDLRANVIKIDDFYGTTLEDLTIDSILVTNGSLDGAKKINEKRLKNNLNALRVLKTKLVKGDDGETISSTRIRNGEIDRNGFCYINFLTSKGQFVLPSHLRNALKRPFGKVVSDSKKIERLIKSADKSRSITVGDATTAKFLSYGEKPFLSIVDFKIQRIRAYKKMDELGFGNREKVISIKNPAGIISRVLCQTIFEHIHSAPSDQVLRIFGEEDLAVIPCVLLAPLGFNIFYGLRNEGLVRVHADLKVKSKILKILKKFA